MKMYLINIVIILLFGTFLVQGGVTKNENQSFVAPNTWGNTRQSTIGADVTDRTKYPYHASVQRANGDAHLCSASLIDKEHLLTSAHCLHDPVGDTSEYQLINPEDLQVVLGTLRIGETSGAVVKSLKYIFIHEDFSHDPPKNDIAIIRISEEIEDFTDTVDSVVLATETPAAETECTSSGWGTGSTSSDNPNLKENVFDVVARESCTTQLDAPPNVDEFCGANSIEACQGEPGSPVICNGAQAGIVSQYTCSSVTGPITDVSYYSDWIAEQQQKFVSGDVEDRSKYAYHASVQLVDGNTHLCSASLIDKENLLTSAYCLHDVIIDDTITDPDDLYVLKKVEDLQVVLGTLAIGATTGSVVKTLKYIFIHKDWSPSNRRNDIAVIRIAEAFEDFTTETVNIVPLATETPADGTLCVASGWTKDSTSSNNPNLREVFFNTISRGACTTSTGAPNEDEFCAENSIDACQGELGSPVICNGVQAGIVSESTCDTATGPITDVSYYSEWIAEQQKTFLSADVEDRSKYAYHASVQLVDGTHLCSASLIDEENLLTSAYCLHYEIEDDTITDPDDLYVLREVEDLQVVLGTLAIGATTGRVIKALKYIFIHEDWSPSNRRNDIAVIRIAEAFEEFTTDTVSSVPLATETPADGTVCVASGWTKDSTSLNNPNLQEVFFNAISREACTTAGGAPNEDEFCGENSLLTCQGELGSPVICNEAQAGIVSQDTCASATGPITDVFYYSDWIAEQKQKFSSGDVEDRSKYPYHASVQLVDSNTHLCSASLIDKENLLTSAYCLHDFVIDDSITEPDDLYVLKEAEDLQVVLGTLAIGASTGRVVKALKYIFIHEDWSPFNRKNDIAVIRIAEEFEEFTETVKNIALATETPAAGTECVASGWTSDSTSSNNPNLREVFFNTISRGACTTTTGAPNEDEFCAENSIDACQGELGSPVICNEVQAGIVSQSTCATVTGPMTDVSYYADWIEEQQKRSGSSSLMNSVYVISTCILAWMYTYKN